MMRLAAPVRCFRSLRAIKHYPDGKGVRTGGAVIFRSGWSKFGACFAGEVGLEGVMVVVVAPAIDSIAVIRSRQLSTAPACRSAGPSDSRTRLTA